MATADLEPGLARAPLFPGTPGRSIMAEVPVDIQPEPMERQLGGDLTEPETGQSNPLNETDSRRAWEEFGSELAREYEDLMRQCSDMREMAPRNFTQRFELELRRLRNEPELHFDEFGNIVRGLEDSHAVMGITHGWSATAIRAAADFFNNAMFESAIRPLEAKGRGKRDENERLALAVNYMNDELFRKADFHSIAHDRSFSVGAHGTACLRYYPLSKLHFSKNENTGVHAEIRGDITPFIELWPLENILVTNYERPQAWHQDNVFWITPNARMHDIETNEATWEFDQETGVNKMITGRFLNLSKMRGISGKSGAFNTQSGLFHNRKGESSRDYAVSSHPVFDLNEIEGLLPSKIIDWVMSGLFTWQMAMDVGIKVGPRKPVTDDEKREFAARLLRIRWWNVAFMKRRTQNWTLIEFTPSPLYNPESITRRVNSLFVYKYLWNELEFFGSSITSAGYRLEDAADMLSNIALQVAHYNGNPAIIFNRSGLKTEARSEAMNLLRPNGETEVKNAFMRVDQIVQVFHKQEPQDIPQKIAAYKDEFEQATGVLPTIKHGSSNEQTLGELQINQQRSQARLHGIVAAILVEDMRLSKSMIEDQYGLRGKDDFNDWIIKVGGRAGMNMEGVFESIDGLWEDVDLIPAASFFRDRTLLTQSIKEAWALFGGPQKFDVDKTARLFLEGGGMANAETILLPGYQPMSPEDKHKQLAQGNWIEPQTNMPLQEVMLHLEADKAMMRAIIQHQSGFNPKEAQVLFDQLIKIIPIEQRMQENMLRILTAMGGKSVV